MTTPPTPDWAPFLVAEKGSKQISPRAITSRDGVGDRLRAAAFAEIQAREAFNWAAEIFEDAPANLKSAWRGLALAEDRHLKWLLKRMEELNFSVTERPVSDHLWYSLVSCKTARDFAYFMASAEERGKRAGERFHAQLLASDPVTAEIFGQIAREEVEHIALAQRFFPDAGASQESQDSKKADAAV